jgi:nucleotide-binding universal stress UspA family protein
MNSTTGNILVPIDFTEQSFEALRQSYNLAKLSGSKITLLHIIRENNSIWNLFSPKEKEETVVKLKTKLDEFAELISNKELVFIETMIVKGKVLDKILSISREISASFIVIASNNTDKFVSKVVGSTALRIVKEAECPVIIIKGDDHRNGCDNIILPLDLSKETKQKVAYAINFAKLFNSKINVVSLITTSDEYTVNRIEDQIQKVKREVVANGVECSTDLIYSSNKNEEFVKNLLKYSDEILADLIVIMTQQENEIREYFIGSLAREIIAKSNIPVMTIVP